ncbi:MAG: sensor domain-containing diguanylate cyclase [Eubacteriales bacterium]|nr:sensor domain-containing diguanylate cyclase [Eubacteriales bacterium]
MNQKLNQYREVFDDLFEGVYFVDKDRGITFWNQGATQITGFTSEEMLGRYCYDNLLNHVDDQGRQLCLGGCPLHQTLLDGEPRSAQVYLYHKNGYRIRVRVRIRPLLVKGEIVGAAEVFSNADTTELYHLDNQELERLTLFDQLTQLPNRRYIDTYLDHQIRDFQLLGIPFGVMILDLDFFKRINDQYGHSTGDEMLKMVAGTLKNAMRRNDFVGRWGGEEFVAILRGVTLVELRMIAQKICRLVEQSGLKRGEEYLRITISIGATLAQPEDDAVTMIQRADQALYTSKHAGRNRVTLD